MNCPTCGQQIPQTWRGCAPCVAGAHHCVDVECECPVCVHPARAPGQPPSAAQMAAAALRSAEEE